MTMSEEQDLTPQAEVARQYIVEKVSEVLTTHGPMTIKDLALWIGFKNRRRLSMILQYRHDVVVFDGRKWKAITPSAGPYDAE